MNSDVAVAKSCDIEFSSKEHFEELTVLVLKEVKASIVTTVEANACGDSVQGLDVHSWVFEAGEEFEVPAIASAHDAR